MRQAGFALRKFDPFLMPSDLVRRLAVGRDASLREMLAVIGENIAAHGAPPQHLGLIAPRGTGKTFLLRLLGIDLADQAAAGGKVQFLHLPEEMPHVLSAVDFLREIRKRLRGEGPAANVPRKRNDPDSWDGLVTDIDRELAQLFGAGEGLLVLCVENIKDVLRDAFPTEKEQRDLRAWLERSAGRIMLIAASSAGPFDKDAGKALFAIVHHIELAPWTPEETLDFLDRVMLARDGRKLRPEDERVARAITAFTGGSPRMAVALAEVLGADDPLSAAQTLDGLVDNLQEYYLDRLNDIGREGKRCIACLLSEGENVSQTEVARRLSMVQSETAQVFRKLENDNVLIGERLAQHKEKLYRVADRVFVHFYNARIIHHGAERSVLAPILDFLVSAFTEIERVQHAELLIARGMPREGRVLLDTLPALDELTLDFKWWTGVRWFIQWAADLVEARIPGTKETVGKIRRLVDKTPICITNLGGEDGVLDVKDGSYLAEFFKSLEHMKAGRTAAARYKMSNISIPEDRQWFSCLIFISLSYVEFQTNDLDSLEKCVRKAEYFARSIADKELLIAALFGIRYVYVQKKKFDEAEKCCTEILNILDQNNSGPWRSGAYRFMAEYAKERGDLERAEEHARKSIEIAEGSENRNQLGRAKAELANCLLEKGQIKEAIELADIAAAIGADKHEFDDYLNAIDKSAYGLRKINKYEEATCRIRASVDLMDTQGSLYLRARAYASLAWDLSFSSSRAKREDVSAEEVRCFADRALGILGDNPLLAWFTTLALEAKLTVARDDAESVELAHRMVPYARRASLTGAVAQAHSAAVNGQRNLKQYRACIDEAIEALVELFQCSGDIVFHRNWIAAVLGQALDATQRQSELPQIATSILRRIDTDGTGTLHADWARTFLSPALEIGQYEFGVGLADVLLHRRNDGTSAGGTEERTFLILGCIAGAEAWERMLPRLDDAFWETAATNSAEHEMAMVLHRTERSRGRPAAYAVFRGFWNAVQGRPGEGKAAPRITRQLLSNRQLQLLSVGLLTDIADTLAADAAGQFDAEIQMLREFSRFNASGRDPEVLARLNPDVATALRIADPSLALPPLADTGKRKSGKATRAPTPRRKK